MSQPNKIVQISSCMTRGDKRDFTNVFGLDDQNRVWQWDPSQASWKPFRIEQKRGDSRGGF